MSVVDFEKASCYVTEKIPDGFIASSGIDDDDDDDEIVQALPRFSTIKHGKHKTRAKEQGPERVSDKQASDSARSLPGHGQSVTSPSKTALHPPQAQYKHETLHTWVRWFRRTC